MRGWGGCQRRGGVWPWGGRVHAVVRPLLLQTTLHYFSSLKAPPQYNDIQQLSFIIPPVRLVDAPEQLELTVGYIVELLTHNHPGCRLIKQRVLGLNDFDFSNGVCPLVQVVSDYLPPVCERLDGYETPLVKVQTVYHHGRTSAGQLQRSAPLITQVNHPDAAGRRHEEV